MFSWTLLLLALCCAGPAFACESNGSAPTPEPSIDPSVLTTPAQSDCASKVDSSLLQPGAPPSSGMVRVLIELVDGSTLTPDPSIQVEGQYANQVQALISPTDVCRIAAEPEVVRVRAAIPPVHE
jgi:hypothetical protein